jgi:hypothetical protein
MPAQDAVNQVEVDAGVMVIWFLFGFPHPRSFCIWIHYRQVQRVRNTMGKGKQREMPLIHVSVCWGGEGRMIGG